MGDDTLLQDLYLDCTRENSAQDLHCFTVRQGVEADGFSARGRGVREAQCLHLHAGGGIGRERNREWIGV